MGISGYWDKTEKFIIFEMFGVDQQCTTNTQICWKIGTANALNKADITHITKFKLAYNEAVHQFVLHSWHLVMG